MPDSDLKPIEISATDTTSGATASAVRNLREVKGAADNLAGALGKLSGDSASATSALEGAFSKIAGRLAGGAMAVGLFAAVKNVRDELAALGDRSEDLRLPAQLLRDMEFAAAGARVSQEKLNSSLDRFSDVSKKDAEDAEDFYTALGNIDKAAVQAFKSAATQEERLRIVGDAYNKTSDEVKRAQLAIEAFGTDNERVMKVLAAGSAGLDEFRTRAAALGITIDESMVRRAQEAQSQMNTLGTIINNHVVIGVANLWKGATDLSGSIKDLADAVGLTSSPFASFNDMVKGTREELANLTAWAQIAAAYIQHPFDEAARAAKVSAALAKRELVDLRNSTLAAGAGIDDIAGSVGARITVRPAFKPRPELNKDTSQEEDALGRAMASVRKRIALTEADTATIGMNTAARERAKVVAELEEAAKRANAKAGEENTEVTKEQRAAIEQLADAMMAATEKLRRSKDAWEGLNETFRYFGNVAGDAFDRLFDKTKSWSDFAVEQAKRVAREMLMSALMGQGAFAKMMGTNSQAGGVGGIFGGLVSAFAGAFGGPAASGLTMGGFSLAGGSAAAVKMADGGMIPAGGLALVSEHKNPRFLRAGGEPIMVTPGEPTGGARTVNINIGLDGANGDAAVRAMVRQGVAQGMAQVRAQIPGIAVQAVSEHTQRY